MRPLARFGWVAAVLALGAAFAPAQAPVFARAAKVDAAVRTEMEKQQLVGVAVGVVRDGKVAYLKGYGLADREKKVPASADTVFNWASNSKPLAAVAAMQLVEAKQLDLDADVRKYVPEFPDKGQVITVRHLLCHQSGIPHYANGKVVPTPRRYATPAPFLDPVNALDRFNLSPLLFKPGEKESYSSYGYVLLSAVVQRAGKKDFAAQVTDRIATPLGMKSLQLDGGTPRPDWAKGYGKAGAAVVAVPDVAHDWKAGAGGYKSNVRDFAAWAAGLINRKLVGEATERAMWTVQKTTSGAKSQYGLGFAVDGAGSGLRVSHNGAQEETKTRMVIYPKARHGVVVLCNCGHADPAAISTAVYAALKGE